MQLSPLLILAASLLLLHVLAKSRGKRERDRAAAIDAANVRGSYITIPFSDAKEYPLYVATADNGEAYITATPDDRDHTPGQRLTVNDYISSVNGKPVFSGNIEDLLLGSEDNEVVIPVVDHEDNKGAGSKLLGFVSMKVLKPKYLIIKREGGDATLAAVDSKSVINNDAAANKEVRMDTTSSVQGEAEKTETIGMSNANANNNAKARHIDSDSSGSSANSGEASEDASSSSSSTSRKRKAKPKAAKGKGSKRKTQQTGTTDTAASSDGGSSDISNRDSGSSDREGAAANKAASQSASSTSSDNAHASDSGDSGSDEREEEEQQQEAPNPKKLTLEDMYGPGRPYPEPYPAGQVPAQTVHERFAARSRHQSFYYSVRFRNGPFGFSFDNRRQDGTYVEKIVNNAQAHTSDIHVGDRLIAVDIYNTTMAVAAVAQKILNSLPWPRVLVFERAGGVDEQEVARDEQSRTFNLTVVYPPTVTSSFQVRVASWTPGIRSSLDDPQSCPLYVLTTSRDLFGCESGGAGERSLDEGLRRLAEGRGAEVAEGQVEEQWPMLSMMLRQLYHQNVRVVPEPATIIKRGLCTFVKKAVLASTGGAQLGLVVNSDDTLYDMVAGKEDTSGCTIPVGSVRESDGLLLHMAAMGGEVLAVPSGSDGFSSACSTVVAAAEDVIDRWAHSVPRMPVEEVLSYTPPGKDKVRGVQHEGGRLAVSGENGWAFFDYHLAMFGPQEVPLGTHRLVFAKPHHGCDPNAYTVRIQGTVVAILRGGGCSFGIKVLNAQKLGARAVVIINTDDVATMRLMAQPDEVPLIKIPTIMVSRRLQYYIESQLKFYFPIDQHFASIQPTGLFHDYEERNKVELPMRLDTLIKR